MMKKLFQYFFKQKNYPYLILTKNQNNETVLEFDNGKEKKSELCSTKLGKINLTFVSNLYNNEILNNTIYKDAELVKTKNRFQHKVNFKQIEELLKDEFISFVDDNFNFLYIYKTGNSYTIPSKNGIGIDEDFFNIIKENLKDLILKTKNDLENNSNVTFERNIELDKDTRFKTKICKCKGK